MSVASSSTESRLRVCVVGSNLVGLVAALKCIQDGHQVDIIDSGVGKTILKYRQLQKQKQELTAPTPASPSHSEKFDENSLNNNAHSDDEELQYLLETLKLNNTNLDDNASALVAFNSLMDCLSSLPVSRIRLMTATEVTGLLYDGDGDDIPKTKVVGLTLRHYHHHNKTNNNNKNSNNKKQVPLTSTSNIFPDVTLLASQAVIDKFAFSNNKHTLINLFTRPPKSTSSVISQFRFGLQLSRSASSSSIPVSHLRILSSSGISVPVRQPYVDSSGVLHPVALHPNKWVDLLLLEKFEAAHGVWLFRFKLQSDTTQLGLFSGQHVAIKVQVPQKKKTLQLAPGQGQGQGQGQGEGQGQGQGEKEKSLTLIRYYTPITRNSNLGYFDLAIKIQQPVQNLPENSMQLALSRVSAGSYLSFKGPIGGFVYHRNAFKNIGMICGGTGITPMLQIMRTVANHSEDATALSLIYGARFESDLLCREELMYLSSTRNNLSLHLVLEQPPPHWSCGEGFIDRETCQKYLPKPELNSTIILLCGPPPMIRSVRSHLSVLGYTDEMIYDYDQPHKPPKVNVSRLQLGYGKANANTNFPAKL